MTSAAPPRWWAPVNPKVTLDAVEKGMLAVTGEDRKLDLGGVLLAAHRVGAGACAQAALTPLLDERRFVSVLADARQNLGEPMLEAVSKCKDSLVDGALLVRDFLDDADQAALGIYRQAVAKGVPSSVAATRAGHIYGIDERSIGKYRQLAVDAKAAPATLQDAADRELFAYFEKVVDEETGDAAVEFTKATPVETEQRDALGRWTSGGATSVATETSVVPQVGALARLRRLTGYGTASIPSVSDGRPSETATKPKKTARQLMKERELAQETKKKKRRPEVAAAEPKTEAPTQAAAPVTRQRSTTRQVSPAVRQQRMTRAQTTTNRQHVDALRQSVDALPQSRPVGVVPTPKPSAELERDKDVLISGYQDTGDRMPTIHADTHLVIDGPKGAAFYTRAVGGYGRIFKLGHLLDAEGADTPVVLQQEENRARLMQSYDRTATGDAENLQIKHLPQELLESDPHMSASEMTRHQIEQFLGDQDDDAAARLDIVPDEGNDGVVLVLAPSGKPAPAVYDYQVTRARGYDRSPDGTDYVIDPTQLYRVRPEENHSEMVTFDKDFGYYVHRVELEPVTQLELEEAKAADRRDRGFDKADTDLSQRIATEPRDETGRWVATPDGALTRLRMLTAVEKVPTAKPVTARELALRRKTRSKKRRPDVKQAAPAPSTPVGDRQTSNAPRQVMTRRQAQQQRQANDVMRQAMMRVQQETPTQQDFLRQPKTMLGRKISYVPDSLSGYAMLSKGDFEGIVDDHSADSVHDPVLLLSAGGVDELAGDYDNRRGADEVKTLVSIGQKTVAGVDVDSAELFHDGSPTSTPNGLRNRLSDLLKEPGVTSVRAVPQDEEGVWTIESTKTSAPPTVLVQLPADIDDGGFIQLRRQAGNLHIYTTREGKFGGISMHAVPVEVWHADMVGEPGYSRPTPEEEE